ncbi:MAG: ABC transporter permease subunit, partial [Anaerolineales bacterium]
MATRSLTWFDRLGKQNRYRLSLLASAAVQVLILLVVASQVFDLRVVEDYRTTVGNLETIHLRRELVGDPILLALVVVGMALPFMSSKLRREPVLLVALQLTIAGLAFFVFWPLAQVFVEGFKAAQGATGFTLQQFEKLLAAPMVARASVNTLLIGSISATLATVIGTLVAYTLTLSDIPWKRLLRVLVVLPLVSPPFAVSHAFIMLFGRRGLITYDLLGITGWSIYGADGIVLVQLISDIPLVVLILMAVFSSINRDLEDAAGDLGGRPLHVLRTVTFPLVTPAILSAWLLSFISSIADFGNPMLIGGGFQVLATQAYIQLIELFDLQLGAALAMILLIPALVAFALQHWITSRRSYISVTGGARTGFIRVLPDGLKVPLFGMTVVLAAFTIL